MKKLLWKILAGLVILIVILFLARNLIARAAVEMGAKRMTGFPLEIGSVNLGLFSSKVDVRNLKLMNPSDFPEKMFVDLPEFRMDYRLGSMLAGSPHITDMLVNLKEVVIVKNSKGESNVQRLKGVTSSSSAGKSEPAKPAASAPAKKTSYRVDQLRVHIGTVTYKDYSKAKPTERTYPLNVNATYQNITDSTDITRLVLMTMLSQVHLPDIGVNMNELKQNLGDVTGTAEKALQGAGGELEKAGKNLGDSLKQLIPNSNK